MIWARLAAEAASWSSWLWQHRDEFEPVLRRLGGAGEFAQAALADPQAALRRVGNTLVFGQPDGGGRILAFIEQTAPRVEHIEQAVGAIQAGQAALSASLGSLRTVSMVTLGFSALTPVVLGAQFLALNRRLGEVQKHLAHLHKKFDAAVVAQLKAGLGLLRMGQDFLEAGDRASAHSRLTAALPDCLRTMKYFGELLGDVLGQGRAGPDEVRLLARHLSVAVLGVASCQIGLEQDRHAFSQSAQELDLLRGAARQSFREAVARDPAPFMHPDLGPSGLTAEFMAGLYRQAQDAGALDPSGEWTASSWFEAHRGAIFHARRPWSGWDVSGLRARLRGAVAAVEEVNRVTGLCRLVEQVRAEGGSVLAVLEEYRGQAAGSGPEDCPFLAWGIC